MLIEAEEFLLVGPNLMDVHVAESCGSETRDRCVVPLRIRSADHAPRDVVLAHQRRDALEVARQREV